MKRLFVLLLALIAISGCMRSVDGYNSDPYIVSRLHAYSGKKISLANFETTLSGSGINQCRGYSLITYSGDGGLVRYIQDAFATELELANLYSLDSPIVLKGQVTQISLSTLTSGEWILKMTLLSNNGRSISVREQLNFRTNIVGQSACQVASDTYSYAVQNLIRKLVTHPNFKLLLGPSNYPQEPSPIEEKTTSSEEPSIQDSIEKFIQQQKNK